MQSTTRDVQIEALGASILIDGEEQDYIESFTLTPDIVMLRRHDPKSDTSKLEFHNLDKVTIIGFAAGAFDSQQTEEKFRVLRKRDYFLLSVTVINAICLAVTLLKPLLSLG